MKLLFLAKKNMYTRIDTSDIFTDSRLKNILDFYSLLDSEKESRQKCLCHLFELIDNMANKNNFFWINRFISFLNLKCWSIEFLVGVLVITNTFNEKLEDRPAFYRACYNELVDRGEDAFEVLKGLERRQDQSGEPAPIYTLPYPTNQYIPVGSMIKGHIESDNLN